MKKHYNLRTQKALSSYILIKITVNKSTVQCLLEFETGLFLHIYLYILLSFINSVRRFHWQAHTFEPHNADRWLFFPSLLEQTNILPKIREKKAATQEQLYNSIKPVMFFTLVTKKRIIPLEFLHTERKWTSYFHFKTSDLLLVHNNKMVVE